MTHDDIIRILERDFVLDMKSVHIEKNVINVVGDCKLKVNTKKLPIKFYKVGGNFNCGNNTLTTLEGCPQYVGGNFFCGNNADLTSLQYSPKTVGIIFSTILTGITSLEGCSNSCRTLVVSQCPLKTLEGLPMGKGKILNSFQFTYSANLPLLRLAAVDYWSDIQSCSTDIIENYLFKCRKEPNKKKAVLEFQRLLLNIDCAGNATW
jgi:hypothetical protein